MSLQSTPARSNVTSASSTPSNNQHSRTPEQLTPRSKIKALVAQFESDTDSENADRITKSQGDAIAKGPAYHTVEKSDAAPTESNASPETEDEDEDSEDEPVVPKGRLAARLHKQSGIYGQLRSDSKSELVSNAYERVKKQMTAAAAKKPNNLRSTSGDVTSSDDTTMLEAPRRRKKQAIISSDSSRSASPIPDLSRLRSLPGLILTPGKASAPASTRALAQDDDSDEDLPANPQTNARLSLLLARKAEEREAKEAAEAQKKAKRESQFRRQSKNKSKHRTATSSGVSENDSDDSAAGRKLTQQARPTRKASKKALEEMNRETQRMSRNMQLAHQAKTKKKITKESFFARFNFASNTPVNAATAQAPTSSTVASSAPASDAEIGQRRDTPSTSPIALGDVSLKSSVQKLSTEHASLEPDKQVIDVEEELPSMFDLLTQPVLCLDKGKGKTVEDAPLEPATFSEKPKKWAFTQPPVKVHPPKRSTRPSNHHASSDSDLEIMPTSRLKPTKLDVFARLPAQNITQGRPLQTLRALAHLTSPSKQIFKPKASMTPAEMHMSLQRRARQQAAKERAEKIQDLKDRGIVVQTAEEREHDQAAVEDLVEKARKEAEDIGKKEKDAAKKRKRENGEDQALVDSSDDDQSYQGSVLEESDIDISGSEEEGQVGGDGDDELEDDIEADDDDEEGGVAVNSRELGLVDDEASEGSNDENDSEKDEDDEEELPVIQINRRSRTNRIVDDEDEEDGVESQVSSFVPGSVDTALFPGLLVPEKLPMGLTQAFAATMADSQTQLIEGGADVEQDSMDFVGPISAPDFPMIDIDDSRNVIPDSQIGIAIDTASTVPEIDLHVSQSQIHYDQSWDIQGFPIATQCSEIPDPTQDVGFERSSPIVGRFVSTPPSTVDTLLLSGFARDASPIVRRKGRLRLRTEAVSILSDLDEDDVSSQQENPDFAIRASAFDVMKKAVTKSTIATDVFDKSKSEAKGMVEEQAQESEDEYAGLGGASDDESAGEVDEEVRKMIDEGEVKVDERQLAAFYADKTRVDDEKAVEKLFKNINSGMLRRKRGAEFDLSDSDDDVEARKRAKRRNHDKMMKALLENANVGKIAEDPKKTAFLRAIEDREDNDDLDFLEQADNSLPTDVNTQEEANSQTQSNAQNISLTKRKQPLQESIPDSANRPPPQARRTRIAKKPSTLAELSNAISFLIEEPHALPIQPASESSDEEANQDSHLPRQNDQDPFANRRRTNPIIDRISLKRAESASTASNTTKLAFYDPATGPTPGFRVPSLLRRATTQVTNVDNHGITAGTERAAGGGEQGDFVRRGGTKKSSINYHAREAEKSRVLKEGEKKRREGRAKMAGERRSMLGILGAGSFD